MTTDVLDGFRDNSIKLGRAISAAEPEPDGEIWSRLYLGQAAQKIMFGVASREEIAKVMATLIAKCEMDAQECSRVFISEIDPTSKAARDAHYKARIAAGILGYINNFIRDGDQAAAVINDTEEN